MLYIYQVVNKDYRKSVKRNIKYFVILILMYNSEIYAVSLAFFFTVLIFDPPGKLKNSNCKKTGKQQNFWTNLYAGGDINVRQKW